MNITIIRFIPFHSIMIILKWQYYFSNFQRRTLDFLYQGQKFLSTFSFFFSPSPSPLMPELLFLQKYLRRFTKVVSILAIQFWIQQFYYFLELVFGFSLAIKTIDEITNPNQYILVRFPEDEYLSSPEKYSNYYSL